MPANPSLIKRLEAASVARCDLNMFHAIMALAENSLISADGYEACRKIIVICRAESQKCLHRYDRETARALADGRES